MGIRPNIPLAFCAKGQGNEGSSKCLALAWALQSQGNESKREYESKKYKVRLYCYKLPWPFAQNAKVIDGA